MTFKQHLRNIIILILLVLFGVWWYVTTPDKAKLDIKELQGDTPNLTKMRPESTPTVQIAEIVGWAKGAKPAAAAGFAVAAFAEDLDHPRWLYKLPNGDILVAESTQPTREVKGIGDWITRKVMSKANGAKVSANRITLLRDADGDGVAEVKTALLEGLNSPFGMALIGDKLYVANTDAVLAFPFKVGETKITAKGEKILGLPAGHPNNHWARNLLYDPKENSLYITIGSNSNIGENGMETEKDRARIMQYELKRGTARVFAYGLRNPNGLDIHPGSGRLWTVVNERDMLGSDGPPDYLTSVDFGTFYGWPWYYWGRFEDRRVPQTRQSLKQYSKPPNYALGPHVAALGLAFAQDKSLGEAFGDGAFVAEHGSWNRAPKSGYEVVYIPFNDRGFPVEKIKPQPILTGFLTKDEKSVYGRPAGLTLDGKGGLLVADDAGNKIWRVTAAK